MGHVWQFLVIWAFVAASSGGGEPAGSPRFQEFHVAPTEIRAGETVNLRLRGTDLDLEHAQLTTPFPHGEAETLPGFRYDTARQTSFHPLTLTDDVLTAELKTDGWPAGVHHLQLNVLNSSGKIVDSRNVAIKVAGPKDRLNVTVGDSWYFGVGTKFGRFLKLRDGALLCQEKLSRDGGRTWQGNSAGFGVGGVELHDGRILGMEYACVPMEGKEGWYGVDGFLSTDSGRTFAKREVRFHVPEAKAAMGHAMHRGPLFMRSLVERADGSLVALMAGWFKSDVAPCPYGHGRPYSRSYACESTDGGLTWRYLSTIGYEPIGSEGYNEGCMRRLPNGELLAVLRTGNETDPKHHDNPIMWSVSGDDGRTWSKPRGTGVDGAYPGLAVLGDGLVVMSYGRPGAMLVFSADNGRTWTDSTCIDASPVSGYADVVEQTPGSLLFGFGLPRVLDPATGNRSNQLRLAEVKYRRK